MGGCGIGKELRNGRCRAGNLPPPPEVGCPRGEERSRVPRAPQLLHAVVVQDAPLHVLESQDAGQERPEGGGGATAGGRKPCAQKKQDKKCNRKVG